ncbi:retrotransposon hot spot (RHS) protein [Trypanosoma cruzi]|nr:retrotransposon hot spot (RHS) protein [Trypanosoma cruzi]
MLGLVARLVLLRGWWALTVSPTGVAVRLHGAPTIEPCERHAQRHWDCGRRQPRVSFGASGTCWPQLGGASGCFTARVLWWHLAVALVMVPTLQLAEELRKYGNRSGLLIVGWIKCCWRERNASPT